MKDSIRKVFLKLFVIIAVSISIITPINLIKADEPLIGVDKTNALTDVEITISQNGIDISEGETIYSHDPIRVEISFSVPVFGDNPEPDVYVSKGDRAYFELSDAFSLISGSTIELTTGSIVVAHVNINTNPSTGMITAEVVFDGDDQVFDGTSNNVHARFVADFEFDDSGAPSSGENYTVVILGKTYTVEVLPQPIVHTVSKTGVVDLAEQEVEWTINIERTQGTDHITLNNYVFRDNLTNVGVYVEDSFLLDGLAVDPEINEGILSYAFTESATSPKVIKFKTMIPDNKYYGSNIQSISNTAGLFDNNNELLDNGSATVTFTPQWISKSGSSSDTASGIYNPTNRTITWTVTVNQMAASLSNVVITDVLPANLTFNNAYWELWDGVEWTGTTVITPNADNEYLLGDIANTARLIIISNVPDEQYTTTVTTYRNNASVRWDGIPNSISSGSIGVPVGFVALTKTGSIDSIDRKQINWTVNFDGRGQTIDDLKLYDLLIYSSSTGFNIGNVTGIPDGVNASTLIPRFDQMYKENSFSSDDLLLTVHPIYIDGNRVGDLLEVTNLSLTSGNSFSFSSEITNPNIYLKNSASTIYNTVSLFSGVNRIVSATRNLNYPNHVLSKELLRRAAISDPSVSVNSQLTTNITEAFDYIEKTAIFRLSINANGFDIPNSTDALQNILGNITIKDTLPEGWEFVHIIDDQDYLLFEGTQNNSNSIVYATDTTPDTIVGMTHEINGREITFNFSSLDKPYVILIKARITDDAVGDYFNENKTTTNRNNLSMSATNWTPGVFTFRDISIQSSILEKRLDILGQGVLNWTVDYKPYDVGQIGNRIEDVLPIGLDIRTDSLGNLLIDDNFAAYEISLNADGSYSLSNQITLIEGSNIFYNGETRTLSFLIADTAQGYRFTYITDITGDPGTVSNTVALIGNTNTQEQTATPYTIRTSDGEASLLRNGWIAIHKTDAESNPLPGATFTLFAEDMTTVIRTGITNDQGNLRMMVLPNGQYYLKETAAPTGYLLDERVHTVNISMIGETVISSINGKTGAASNTLSVINYLSGTVGQLMISKEVKGNAADTNKAFDFTVVFDDLNQYEYLGTGTANGQIRSGDVIRLAHGQSITIIGLPKDISYEIIESDYRDQGYNTTFSNNTGVIIADQTQSVLFVNTRNLTPNTADDNMQGISKIGIYGFGISTIVLAGMYLIIRKKNEA